MVVSVQGLLPHGFRNESLAIPAEAKDGETERSAVYMWGADLNKASCLLSVNGEVLLRREKVVGDVAIFISWLRPFKFYLYIINQTDEMRAIYIEITAFQPTLFFPCFLVWPLLSSHCTFRGLLLITHTRARGRTSLDEGRTVAETSACTLQTSTPLAWFGPSAPASERPQTARPFHTLPNNYEICISRSPLYRSAQLSSCHWIELNLCCISQCVAASLLF
jgi:hypothetical protein